MATVLREGDWEYRDFSYQAWQPDEVWSSLTGSDSLTAQQAQRFFWEHARDCIHSELSKLLGEGWEPAEPLEPNAVKVRKSTTVGCRVDPSDVFLWFLTLGVALVVQLFLNSPRRYVTFQPVEFRLRLQRRTTQQRVKAAA